MFLRKLFIVLFLVTAGRFTAGVSAQAEELPVVFLLGEHEDRYLELSQSYPAVFVALFHNDLDAAFDVWRNFLMDVEDYSARINFDLRGVKLWLTLYVRPDGQIAHIAFYPKPNGKLLPNDQLAAFFRQFARERRLPVTWDKGFQHSASASFPTHFARSGQETVRKD